MHKTTHPIAERLAQLNIILPTPTPAVAAYVPYVIADNLLVISGQLPMMDGRLTATGLVGKDISLEQANAAARCCAINILAQVNAAIKGDWSLLNRCVRLGGFVASTSDFHDQSKVMNGASELLEQVLGEQGKHTRTSVSVTALPMNASVEVEALFLLQARQ